jgi:hypothetical protein
MVVYDLRVVSLKKNNRKIDMLRVAGVAAEFALRLIALHGLGVVDVAMLGSSVVFTGVEVNGVKMDEAKVALDAACAGLALTVAVDAMTRLRKQGYAVLPVVQYGRQTSGVLVPQRGQATSSIVGAHDMILDCTEGPKGRISTELKLRRVRDAAHLERVRVLVHGDCDTVWDAAVSESPGVYGGQLLLLYTFPLAGEAWVSRADFRKTGEKWKPLWGWKVAVHPLRISPQVAPVRFVDSTEQIQFAWAIVLGAMLGSWRVREELAFENGL